MMGDTVIEKSKSEKYLSDQIHEDGCKASITATLNRRIPSAIDAARSDKFKLKQALWAEKDKEIRIELDKLDKL